MKTLLTYVSAATVSLFLLACSEPATQAQTIQTAVAIENSDECHLCGMLISHFPGPKGELYRSEINPEQAMQVKKFCSTRDLFSFYLDPENTRNVKEIYVHDMSMSPWETPNDEHFINARKAWYVAGSNKNGAMGVTLASFSAEQDAKTFAKEFGGNVYDFTHITLNELR